MRRLFLWLLVVFAFVGVIRPYLHDGFPDTHDGVNHLARIANYAVALRQGQFPPRLAPTFWGGYGYPVFNYNYPLVNMLAAPFLAIKMPVEFTLKILMIFAIAFGAYGTYKLLTVLVGSEAALLGTGAYLTAPFLFNNVAVRGVVGEIAAYAIAPHVFNAAVMVCRSWNKRSATYLFLSSAALLLAHNIFAMFFVPLLAVMVIIWMLREKTEWTSYSRVASLTVLAVGASMFFWIPALFEQQYVTIALVNLVAFYKDHFPTLQEMLFAPFKSGLSFAGPVDTLSFQIGWIFIAAAGCAVMGIFAKGKRILSLTLLASMVLFVLFLLPISTPIWEHVPFLTFTQFPWRLLAVVALLGTGLTALVYKNGNSSVRWVFAVLLFLSVVSTWNKPVSSYIHHDDLYYKTFAETSTVQHENKPRTLTKIPGDLSPQKPLFKEGEIISTEAWSGSYHRYRIYVPKESEVTEPTAYFPGWKVYVDDKEAPITHEQAEGLIHFTIPAGEHRVETEFTQFTPARIVGNSMSALSIFVFMVFLFNVHTYRKRGLSFFAIALLVLIWRLATQVFMYHLPLLLQFKPSYPYYHAMLLQSGPWWLVRWAGFDGVHYITIALRGYLGTALIQAFFPLFPSLISVGKTVLSVIIAGFTLNHIALICGLFVLYRLILVEYKERGKAIGFWTILGFLLFPMSFFFVALYTESLFFFLLALTLYAARTKHWLFATIFAVLLSATRISGVFVVPTLLIMAYLDHKSSGNAGFPWKRWLLVSCSALG
ncbi:MAG TPA: 6-pyruvoyl-tetrahydropterin synthase-related protein, partial [Patescibacteria group bacterium]|nr:6-pyruvoyl-tetrahydropterin synthase-related protein [Patescibacteria group bacterium]